MGTGRVAQVVVVAAGLTLSGCTQLVDGSATAGFEPGHSAESSGAPAYKPQSCEQLHADQWIEVPGSEPGQPRVRVAQPPGWDPVPEAAKGVVKLMLRNTALGDGVTNPVVSLSTGDVTDGDRTPRELLADSIKGLESSGGQKLTQERAEICEFPAIMASYTIPPDDDRGKTIYVTAVTVMVPLGSRVWNVIAMAQTTVPSNPTYMADVQVMLAGLRIAMPR
ncbi:hypothetical protein FR943_06665 [Mycobacterium sp. TNTM28]|uniref:Lipoprotein LpqN n=1 Tax=[Mycobacterium] fortunisiensis TaxID=2600579 RepID=A0ABS6KIT7_9MYCO|nr:LpqN/LpqT family lipoprotein [[Mycobacterium] fortunisiensis]MBU9763524.1 hypothetical protein [[Mycobacterium] fortunisiensis]